MGIMKDLMIEERNSKFDELLSKELGLSQEELESLDYRIDDLTNNDGLLYGYQVVFPENTPIGILNKVRNVRNNSVFVDLNVFEQIDEYYGEQLDAISKTKGEHTSFVVEIENLNELLLININSTKHRDILLRQIYISVFGALETFLSDTFISLVRDNLQFLRNFVETYPEFSQRKFELREVFNVHDNIRDSASKVMLDVIYHDLRKVRIMYTTTLKIKFPEIKSMMQFLSIRHDLVHRNGKGKDGKVVPLDEDLVRKLITEASKFVKEIAEQLPKHNNNSVFDDDLPF